MTALMSGHMHWRVASCSFQWHKSRMKTPKKLILLQNVCRRNYRTSLKIDRLLHYCFLRKAAVTDKFLSLHSIICCLTLVNTKSFNKFMFISSMLLWFVLTATATAMVTISKGDYAEKYLFTASICCKITHWICTENCLEHVLKHNRTEFRQFVWDF